MNPLATSKGSWWAFGLALLGLAAGIGGIFFWDLYKTNRRQDKALEYLKRNPQILSESDRARTARQADDGDGGADARAARVLADRSVRDRAAVPPDQEPRDYELDVVQNAMAALITLVTAVVAFYFGTRSAQTSIASLPPPPPLAPPRDGRARSRRRMRCGEEAAVG